ncbi:hypothetical protein [Kordia jejudonensis]|uniref:hypothetical protein n=1 Tax=Kordia jejudonensis TaxID=1348245 RepID=UPI000629B788|nr:hypothetical protein [Kordia jejudonensis]
MKKKNLKSLKLNKKSISSFSVLAGRAPDNGGDEPIGPPNDDDFVWFTDGGDHTCRTFPSWCSFTTG